MQRTAVLYTVAAATLVGAFLLVVPAAPPEPTEPAPPPTPAGEPLTHLTWSDGVLQVEGRLDRGRVLPEAAGEPVWMDLSIKAVGAAERAAVAAVLVIDRSGSMAGEKIDHARMAAERLIRRLADGDQVSVVSYGTDVSVDLPLTNVDSRSREKALAVVRRIEEGGGTNIDGALKAATRIAGQGLGDRVGRVILLSDGRATEGERRTAMLAKHGAALRAHGVTTSTLGVGLDYHEDLMQSLATVGGGRYHYLKRASMLGKILDDELQHASRIVARDVQIRMPSDLGPLLVAAAPGQLFGREGQAATVRLGDLAAGEVRHVLVRLDRQAALGRVQTGGQIHIPAPELTYQPLKADQRGVLAHRADSFRVVAADDVASVEASRRDDVRARILKVQTAGDLQDSMKRYARGDVKTAAATLEEKARVLKDLARRTQDARLQSEAANLDDVLSKMRSAAPSSSAGADLVKSQKAHAWDLQR